MTQIPRSALLLGLAGLIPFIWGAITVMVPSLAFWGQSALGGRFIGPFVQLFYGAIILSFMSGVLWGFATKATGQMATASYILSVIPALWAFFMTGGGPTAAAVNLIVGGIFMALTFVIFVLYGVFAAFARTWLLQSKTVMLWLNRSFAGIFAALGLRLAFEKT